MNQNDTETWHQVLSLMDTNAIFFEVLRLVLCAAGTHRAHYSKRKVIIECEVHPSSGISRGCRSSGCRFQSEELSIRRQWIGRVNLSATSVEIKHIAPPPLL